MTIAKIWKQHKHPSTDEWIRKMWSIYIYTLDPLEEGMATHSSVRAWRIPTDRGAWWARVHGVAKSQT